MKVLLLASAALLLAAAPAAAQQADPAHAAQDMTGMDMSGTAMAGMDMSATPDLAHPMSGALGGYSMSRDASGTAWQPDASQPMGPHHMYGPWTVMTHATLNAVYDQQNGRRGDEKGFVSGMVMGMASRAVGDAGHLQLRAMFSPDPFMGPSGYPLLLASGETADGRTPLIDRQHPHELVMELSATYFRKLAASDSVFVYAGLPGEPAFGPPAFMHRLSIMDSPEAPISHHWLDSDHITFGVLTAGWVHEDWKLEASRFKGREPDEHRFDIETPKLDSTAARLSWNPTANWSLQASWAHVVSPEQLEPEANQRRLSASAIYTLDLGADRWWSTTAAWGRRSSDGIDLDAWVLESAIKPTAAWTIFARAECTQNNELLAGLGHHAPVFTVAKASIGAIRDFRMNDHLAVGLGGLYAVNVLPSGLSAAYGGDPTGAMAFVRLKLQ
jgi:hypothetical protein